MARQPGRAEPMNRTFRPAVYLAALAARLVLIDAT